MKHLEQFPLSWRRRINLTKMLLLPWYFYISRTIPHLIPLALISKIQSLFLKCTWGNKKPGFNRKYLYCNSKLGGLSVPNLIAYIKAFILEPVRCLWNSPHLHYWSQLENKLTRLNIHSLGFSMPTPKLLSLAHAVQTWQKYVIGEGWLYLPRDTIPVSISQCWIPNLSLTQWSQLGPTMVDPFF